MKIALLKKAKECAESVGIADKMFISFGTSLGAVRPTIRRNECTPHYIRGFMEHDSDADLGFLADKCKPGQIEAYYQKCVDEGLMDHWAHPTQRIQRRQDNNEILWFSIKSNTGGFKSCNWMFWEWKGYYLHSKGGNWTNERKFPSLKFPRKERTQALALGAPAKYFTKLVEINIEGMRMNIPGKIGSLLDFWYPGWAIPKKGGASSKKIVVIINRWDNKSSWRIL